MDQSLAITKQGSKKKVSGQLTIGIDGGRNALDLVKRAVNHVWARSDRGESSS